MRRRDDRSWICMSGEWKIPRLVCPLVRIDPGEDGGNDGEWEVCRRMIDF